ncbi:hypothetical protein Patl1_03447 [Pistacia atlantica]|uniref:Uncharacterized protein n=1 Tax=Pistacia atlantica TaxID=434234 RepID=A0ACC1CD50_9ROSI|nr:hypothetical protein Patl1_03447 [Pistacia atlantica]
MAAQLRGDIADFCKGVLASINLPPRLRNIFHPLEETPYKWTSIWLSIISTMLDPFFFYIFHVNDHKKCLRLDTNLMIAVCLIRLLVDSCHIIFICYHERRRRIIFVVLDAICILPLPQVMTLIIRRARGSEFIDKVKWLKYTIIAQYLPKLIRICKLYIEAERAPGMPVGGYKTGSTLPFCFIIYLLPGHVFGGLWYLMAIERVTDCWKEACSYGFGIFQDALQYGIVEETKFMPKLFYCLRWGLITTSSMAQDLRGSSDVEENLFVIWIVLTSLMLSFLVYGRLQIYLQFGTQRLEER